jgi:hypothetical protein
LKNFQKFKKNKILQISCDWLVLLGMSNYEEESETQNLVVQETEGTKASFFSGKNVSFMIGVTFSVAFVFSLSAIILTFFLINKVFINLPNSIEYENILPHLKNFERIAFEHPSKSRSVADAHNTSAAYVISVLKSSTGCQVSTQNFKVPVYTEISNPTLSIKRPFNYPLQHMVDFRQLRFINLFIQPKDTEEVENIPLKLK